MPLSAARTAGVQGDMNRLGIEMPASEIAYSVEEAEAVAAKLGYPVRDPSGLHHGAARAEGHVYNPEELRVVAARGLAASGVGQILVEESVWGWEELELEVVRDAKNQMITVCFIENWMPWGPHGRLVLHGAHAHHFTGAPEEAPEVTPTDIVEAIQSQSAGPTFSSPTTRRRAVSSSSRSIHAHRALRRWLRKATGFPIALISADARGGAQLWTRSVLAGRGHSKSTPLGETTWS